MCYKEDPWTVILCVNALAAALLMVVVPVVCAIGIPFEAALVVSMALMAWVNMCDDTRCVWHSAIRSVKGWVLSTKRTLSRTN